MNPTILFKIQGCQLPFFLSVRGYMLTDWTLLSCTWTSATGAIIIQVWFESVCLKQLHFFFPGVYCIIPSLGSRKWILLIRQIKCLLRPYEHNADCRQDLPWELRGWNTPTTINWHSLPTLGYTKWYSPHGSVVLALQIGAVPSLVHRRLLGQMCAFIILVLCLLCNNLCFGEQSCQ